MVFENSDTRDLCLQMLGRMPTQSSNGGGGGATAGAAADDAHAGGTSARSGGAGGAAGAPAGGAGGASAAGAVDEGAVVAFYLTADRMTFKTEYYFRIFRIRSPGTLVLITVQ